MKFLERREPIEAVCWDGSNKDEIWNICRYAKFAENLKGEVEVIVPLPGGKTFTLSVGDFIAKTGDNGLCTPFKRSDFLYKYEEYEPDVPRVQLNVDVTELNKNSKFIFEVDTGNYPLEVSGQMMDDIRKNLDKNKINGILTMSKLCKIKTTELNKNGTYLLEFNKDVRDEVLQDVVKQFKEAEVDVLYTYEDNIRVTRLQDI